MSKKLIAEFWEAMGTNDFSYASSWLHPDFEYYMPQTSEYLCGRDAFAALNHAYPTNGKWTFVVQSIVADGNEAVSDVEVTDGSMNARAITFHELKDGLILRQTEFWPDNYSAPNWRTEWTKTIKVSPF